MLYITVVAIATVLISLASFAVGGIHDAWALALSLFGTLFAVAAVFAVDGVLAFRRASVAGALVFSRLPPIFRKRA